MDAGELQVVAVKLAGGCEKVPWGGHQQRDGGAG